MTHASPRQTTSTAGQGSACAGLRQHDMLLRALGLIEEVLRGSPNDKEDYATIVMGLGPMILHSGLPQTCAFLLAKGTSAHKAVLRHLVALLSQTDGVGDQAALNWYANTLLPGDRARLRLLTRRALQAATVLKRYTQAKIKTSEG